MESIQRNRLIYAIALAVVTTLVSFFAKGAVILKAVFLMIFLLLGLLYSGGNVHQAGAPVIVGVLAIIINIVAYALFYNLIFGIFLKYKNKRDRN